MSTTDATGHIRILTIPAGEAPEYVRAAWVGLELPCLTIAGIPKDPARTVVSLEPLARPCYGFFVPQDQALAILKRHSYEAAQWWKEHHYPQSGQFFHFALSEAAIVDNVTLPEMVEVTDEMMGDPTR